MSALSSPTPGGRPVLLPQETFTRSEIERFYAAHIPGLRFSNTKELRCSCPLHGGRRDSFSIEPETGRWFCHSECNCGGDIFEFQAKLFGQVTAKDDFPRIKAAVYEIVGRIPRESRPSASSDKPQILKASSSTSPGRIVETYSYPDEHGNLLYEVVRKYPKAFLQRRPDGHGGWIWNLAEDTRRVLYHLDEVSTDPESTCYIAEGEADADRLRSLNLGGPGTCNPGGAGKWDDSYSEALKGRACVLFYDADQEKPKAAIRYPGQVHAAQVANSLLAHDCRVRLVHLPRGHKDVSDFLDADHTREELIRLIDASEPLTMESLAAWGARFGWVPERTGKGRPRESGRENTVRVPSVLNVADLLALHVPAPEMLIADLLPKRGATLVVGKPKSGKTLLSMQIAISVASGHPLFDFYSVLDRGAAMIVEQDDPAGAGSVKEMLTKSPVPVADIPFYLVPKVPFSFSQELVAWLEHQISSLGLRLLVLDSYTALRSSRSSGCDIVKVEQNDMLTLDSLAKRSNCTILIVHHASKGSVGMDWTEQAAGSFAMAAAVESQLHVSRYAELDGNSPERLVRVQGRHLAGTEFVIRFRKHTLDYEHVLEGSAASVYPLLLQIREAFGQQHFSPKDVCQHTGVSRATAHRILIRLYQASAITKRGTGQYVLA